MDTELLSFLSIEIPPSLRPISLFLGEAQKAARGLASSTDENIALRYERLTIAAITHAFKLLVLAETHVDDGAKSCLDQFQSIYNRFCQHLSIPSSLDHNSLIPSKLKIVVSHTEDLLMAEAMEILNFAYEQLNEDMKEDACRNFHAAAVFFRVLESLVPNVHTDIRNKLKITAGLIRENGPLHFNLIREHFCGSSCSEFYDVHGRNKLGKGSYGSVYLATHRVTRDERAVKVMNVDRITSYYLKKLHTEIEILREVDHPNIVKLQDVFFGRRSVYLVTDLCRGGELYELLTSGKNQGFVFREDRAARLMRDMLSSIHYLHRKGIVHRDLKLENFLFEGDSASSPLIMIDFGLSKHFDPHERMNQRVGSCYYTAPEVLSGDYDYRCDIWSLGVICYMLLSGSPPFYGKTPEDIHHATLTKEAEFPERRFRHVSLMGLDFMRRLLTKNPNHRISTEEALAHPFITTHCANPPEGVPVISSHHILNSFRVFANLNLVLKIILQLVAYTLPPEQLSPFRYEFQQVDTNHDGVVQLSELLALGSPEESPEIEELYYQLFITHSRSFQERVSEPTLSYSEYLAAAICHRIEVSPERVLIAFDLLDIDSEGCITPASIISYFGEDIDQNTLKHEILELKSYYEPTNGHSYLPSDGIGKSILLEAWNQARLSSCIPPPPPYGSFVRNNSDSSLNSAMEQCSS
mmetsp:Transcript_12384/g.12789  ORF Transcript_12384/g.12789 Transcript_12384/m.12789 type:complete len:695 (-) Transcript_12384:261-2345(-)